MNKEWKKAYNYKYRQEHKEYLANYVREWRQKHSEEQRIHAQKYYQENKRHIAEYYRRYYQEHKEQIKERWRKYRQEHKEQVGSSHRESIRRLKEEVLRHYGNGELACVNCGFTDIRALSIDHIKNNGVEERRKLGKKGSGYRFYRWLKSHDYPEGYQTLCMNCQFIKRTH